MVQNSRTKTKRTKTKALKILMLVGYSSGSSGIWQRVKDEAKQFALRGHKVSIYSSDAVKGQPHLRAKHHEEWGGGNTHVVIRRFPYRKLGGESYMTWNFKKAAIEYEPDLIITHSYRHTHSDRALKVAKKIGCKCFCVTHAPFVHKRSLPAKMVVAFKDHFSNIDRFDKVIPISKWEIPFLKQLGTGLWPQKIKRIPNPTPDHYYEGPINPGKGLLFLGRVHPIKDISTLIKGIGHSKHYNELTLVGDGERDEEDKLMAQELKSEIKIDWRGPLYGDDKIKAIDEHEIFILTSTRDAKPIALVEAMARGKIVVATKTDGSKEIIKDYKTGFLFDIKDSKALGNILDKIAKMPEEKKKQMREAARDSVQEFKMSKVMKIWESLFKKIK